MLTSKRSLPFLILIILIAGCMLRTGNLSIEDQNPQSLSEKIRVGETTREDIQKEFGDAGAYSTAANGTQTWTYSFVGHNWFWVSPHLKRKTLQVIFDRSGKVLDYNLSEANW